MDSAAASNVGCVLTVAGVLFSRGCPCVAIGNVFGLSDGSKRDIVSDNWPFRAVIVRQPSVASFTTGWLDRPNSLLI